MTAVDYHVDNHVAILTISNPPVNALSHAVRTGIADRLQRALGDHAVEAVVLIGAGKNFIAGVDIREFGKPREPPTLRDLMSIIESSSKPIIAAIDGFAVGGGLELALACHRRIATPAAQVGLPEVKLGLIPGGGGTQRLPRLAGPEAALEMITSGNSIDAKAALTLGIIDELIDGDLLSGALGYAARVGIAKQPLRLASQRHDRVSDVDPELFNNHRQKIARKARGQLAPWKCIDSIEVACTQPFDKGYQYELDAFRDCEASPQRAALIHLFFAEREARKIADIPSDIEPLKIRSAAVIGAGTMGSGIAMCFANAGIPVKLLDVSADAVVRGLELIEKNYAVSVKRGSLREKQVQQAMLCIQGAESFEQLREVDIVIEAVFEDMEVKQKVFREIDKYGNADAILATNTSTLDIDQIATATSRPDKVVGTHFFSPANVMKLLETVRGSKSSPQTITTVMALGKKLGKVAVLARNADGFIGNRMLRYYTEQAEFLLEEGASPQQIDQLITDFGFPMGPLAVRDLVGNDVGWLIRKANLSKLPDDHRVSPILQRLYEMGRYGQKTGAGFYRYEGRTAIPDPEAQAVFEQVSTELGIKRREIESDEILARLLHPLVNAGAKVLDEGVAQRAGDIDVVYVNGYGFPAYRGGPMFWGERIGLDQILTTMSGLQQTFGSSWQPATLLKRMVESGQSWSDI
jgi:3-hydroxyacyl-CoA dehydrogenase